VFLRVFAVLSASVVVGLAALMLHAGEPDELWWWGMAAPFGVWIIGPAIAPYVVARRRRDALSRRTMLAFFLVSSTVAAFVYFDAFFRSGSSTAGLAFVFVPLYQWAALLVCLTGVFVIRRMTSRS